MEHHGGTIEANSQGRGCGTEFVIEIPLYECHEMKKRPSLVDTTASSNSGHESDHDSNRHILVVDDIISNTKMLVRLLERAGHTCTVASNGQEALDAYVANQTAAEADGSFEERFDTVLMVCYVLYSIESAF